MAPASAALLGGSLLGCGFAGAVYGYFFPPTIGMSASLLLDGCGTLRPLGTGLLRGFGCNILGLG
jgi:hypothetical protein